MAERTRLRNPGIKVIGLDCLGTTLPSFDEENVLSPRKGFAEFFDRCKSLDVKIVSTSDAGIRNIQLKLESVFDRHGLTRLLEMYDGFYRLNEKPYKDFSEIIRIYGILPAQLLVIGDSYKDICGAIRSRACWVLCPEYIDGKDRDTFDFSRIDLKTGRYLKCQ
jgi:phosphoglycolate phosphatase-like HAD superfamily hydrolase